MNREFWIEAAYVALGLAVAAIWYTVLTLLGY